MKIVAIKPDKQKQKVDVYRPARPVQPAFPSVAQQKVISTATPFTRQLKPRPQLPSKRLSLIPEASPTLQRQQNKTGLPNNLKSGIEALSGMDVSDVRVHYNSSKPAQLNALAYAQGTDIHVGPRQEKHLPHEAWHTVQQRQGRVKPTMQMGGVAINDQVSLEREADVMGAKSLKGIAVDWAKTGLNGYARTSVRSDDKKVAQMVWNQVNYNVDNSARVMHVDYRQVNWGGTGGQGNHAQHAGNERAILFETMTRETGFVPLINRLSQPATLWDTGLSVVVNRAYTPTKIYDGNGMATNQDKTQGNTLQEAQNALNNTYDHINAWQGMPINVITAAWERREVDRGEGSALEAAQGSVPYSTFRRIAATSAGTTTIENELKTNHGEGNVWRKMGDDDMPYVNPNANTPETQKLEEVEQKAQTYVRPTLVTFGYDLVTAGTQAPITGILSRIYAIEMELRDKIAELGAPMYPSEPTTFYQARINGNLNAQWAVMEGVNVGGSGQQLEGAKLARAMDNDGGKNQYVFHTIMVQTGAGSRNDALIALLNGWYNNGQGDPALFRADRIEQEINGLDQSALRQDEYLNKVVGNLGGELDNMVHNQIQALVIKYRKRAAEEACKALKAAIPAPVKRQHQDQRFLDAWNRSQQERAQKWGW
ncbi:MAG: DUF4157 domain-containing protein [Chloroflexota bacterium]